MSTLHHDDRNRGTIAQRAEAIAITKALALHPLAPLPQSVVKAAIVRIHALDVERTNIDDLWEHERAEVKDTPGSWLTRKENGSFVAPPALELRRDREGNELPVESGTLVASFKTKKEALAFIRKEDEARARRRDEYEMVPGQIDEDEDGEYRKIRYRTIEALATLGLPRLRREIATAEQALAALRGADQERHRAIDDAVERVEFLQQRLDVIAQPNAHAKASEVANTKSLLAKARAKVENLRRKFCSSDEAYTKGRVGEGSNLPPSEAVMEAEEALELLKDGFWRIRILHMVERTDALGLDAPVRFCLTCESVLVYLDNAHCSPECARRYPRRQAEEEYTGIPDGRRCSVCCRWHRGGAFVPVGRAVPLDDPIRLWGRGKNGSGVPYEPWLTHLMLQEPPGPAPVCSVECWQWLIVDSDEPPAFSPVEYTAVTKPVTFRDVTGRPPEGARAMTDAERARVYRERRKCLPEVAS
jgi:hypothetical protein